MNSKYPILFSLSVLLWISICSTQLFSSSSIVLILKMNGMNYCEAKPLELSNWKMTFLRYDEGLALYQQITGFTMPPTHNPGQSIHWLHNQQMGIKNPLTPPSTFHLISIIPNKFMNFYHNNQTIPPDISSANVFVCVMEPYKWWMDLFSLNAYFPISENCTLSRRRWKAYCETVYDSFGTASIMVAT